MAIVNGSEDVARGAMQREKGGRGAMGATARSGTMTKRQFLSWLGVGLLLLCVYLLTGSRQYDLDVLAELTAINHLSTASADPAHMLYVRMGVPFYRLWLALGYAGDALRPMQVLNSLFGAGTILLFILVLYHFTSRWSLALLVGLTAGFSYGFWTQEADAFFIIPASFFAVFALFCALELRLVESGARRGLLVVALGTSLSLAALSYQANLLLIPALAVASWPDGTRRIRVYLQNWVSVGFIVVVIAGGAWVQEGIANDHVHSIGDLFWWFMSSHGGMQHKLWRTDGVNLATTVPLAWLASILPVYDGLHLRELIHGVVAVDRIPSLLALTLLIATAAYAIVTAAFRPFGAWISLAPRRALFVFAAWFVIPGLAVAWFDPAEVKLWLIPMFAFWAMFVLVLTALSKHPSGKAAHRLSALLPIAFAVLVPLSNFLLPVWPNHTTPSQGLQLAQVALQQTTQRDLLISAGFDWTGYVGYVSDQRHVLNLISVAQSHGQGAVDSIMLQKMVATWKQGGHVYIVDYFESRDQQLWTTWITPFTHLTPADFQRFRRTVAWQTGDETVWELSPTS